MDKAYIFFTTDLVNTWFCYLLWFQPDIWVMVLKNNNLYILFSSNCFDQKNIVSLQDIRSKLKNPNLNIEFLLLKQNLLEILNSLVQWCQIILEKKYITYNNFEFIKNNFGNIDFVDSFFDDFKKIKNNDEIAKIKKAIKITDEIYLWIEQLIVSWEILNMTEKQVQNFIVKSLLDNWAEKEAFGTIVASLSSSAIPHYQTSNVQIWNWPLLIDAWVIFENYCSDFTRTYWVGGKNEDYKLFKEIYEVVKTAYSLALDKVKVGTACKDLDLVVREYFASKGYEKYFTHSLGHGIGMQPHEVPTINYKSNRILEENMFFALEPGIYLPWKFGVRLENTIHLTSSWPVVYSKLPI